MTRTFYLHEVGLESIYNDEGFLCGHKPDLPKSAPIWAHEAAQKVVDELDGSRCPYCESRIGWYEWSQEDNCGREREGLDFLNFWLVDDLSDAWPLCEDCTIVFEKP